MKPTPFLLLLAMLTGTTSLAPASSWPQFRGPNSSGVAPEGHPPITFGADNNQVWKTEVPGGVSSPCVWEERIFITASEDNKLFTLALDSKTGQELWRQAVVADEPREIHKRNHPAAATPATDGHSVCVYHPTFGLIAYDFEGHELWRKSMPGLLTRNGSGTSPAILGSRLVLNCDVEENKSFLAAYEPATGKEVWNVPRTEFLSGYTTPIRWQHEDRDEIVVVGSLRVVGYNLTDGKQRWSIGGTEAVSVCPTPVVGDDQLYVMSRSFGGAKLPPFALFALGTDKNGDGKITREEVPQNLIEQGIFSGVDRNQDGIITQPEWDESTAFIGKGEHGIFALKPPGEGELGTNQVVWKHKKAVASVSSPLFYQDRVYVVQDGGRVSCFAAKSGDKLFEQERLGAEGEYYASPIAANGYVYFASTRGVVSVIEAADKLSIKASNKLEEPIMATPAIVGPNLYVRTEHHLWAFCLR